MEALGDSVVAGEAPHAGDLLTAGVERRAVLHQWGEPAITERADISQETMCQLVATFLAPPLFQQRVAESLFEAVNRLQHRPFSQIQGQAFVLWNCEVMAMPPHQGNQ